MTAGKSEFVTDSAYEWAATCEEQYDFFGHCDDEVARIRAFGRKGRLPGSRLKPTFVMELIRLHTRGPMTIAELAESVQRSHSAMSRKVAAMRAAGFVRTTPDAHTRSTKVTLTTRARRIVGPLMAEWRAADAAIVEIEAEMAYPLSKVVADIEEALQRKNFHGRVAQKMAEDPAWQ